MATLNLYAGEDTLVLASYGIGFYGDNGFDDPVVVGEYQGHTFVTNSSGTVQKFECNNNKYLTASTVIHGQEGSGISLQNLPNELATANIRFTHGTGVYCQMVKMWIFDGTFNGENANKDRPAENITFKIAELRHPSNLQTVVSTYTDATWSDVSASGSNYISLVESPGSQGVRQGGFEVLSTRHDWYVAMSCTPTALGDKQFGVTVEFEYL